MYKIYQELLSNRIINMSSGSNDMELFTLEMPNGNLINSSEIVDLLLKDTKTRISLASDLRDFVNLSIIINKIQKNKTELEGVSSNNFISDVYTKVINNIEFYNIPLSFHEKERYDKAINNLYTDYPFTKLQSYKDFCTLRIDTLIFENEINEVKAILKENRDTLGGSKKLIYLEKEYDNNKILLDSIDVGSNFSKQEEIINFSESKIDNIPESYKNSLMFISKLTEPISSQSHIQCNFIPSKITDDKWVKIEMYRKEIINEIGLDALKKMESDNFSNIKIGSIYMEIQILYCSRPWLWDSLFTNKNWKWKVALNEVVSSANFDLNSQDLIPAYINSLTFMRNLVVKSIVTKNDLSNFEGDWLPRSNNFQSNISITYPRVRTAIKKFSGFHSLNSGLNSRSLGGESFSAQIIDEENLGIPNASIFFHLQSEISGQSVKTNSDGTFKINNLAKGVYNIKIAKLGYLNLKETIVVPHGGVNKLKLINDSKNEAEIQIKVNIKNPKINYQYKGAVNVIIKNSINNYRLEKRKVLSQDENTVFRVSSGKYVVELYSERLEKIIPAGISFSLARGEKANLTFNSITAVILSEKIETILFNVVCKKVPPCPT